MKLHVAYRLRVVLSLLSVTTLFVSIISAQTTRRNPGKRSTKNVPDRAATTSRDGTLIICQGVPVPTGYATHRLPDFDGMPARSLRYLRNRIHNSQSVRSATPNETSQIMPRNRPRVTWRTPIYPALRNPTETIGRQRLRRAPE